MSLRWMTSRLTGAAVALWAAGAAAQSQVPQQILDATSGPSNVAIWKTGDADTTVYLFGTVHILQPTIEWSHNTFETAWAESDVVYFEADVLDPDAQAALGPLILKHGFDQSGKSLASYFTPAERETIDAAVAKYGITLGNLGSMRPWFASLNLAQAALGALGGTPEAGVEMILGGRAKAEGKSLRFFETLEEQILFFANMSDEEQARMMLASLEQLDDPAGFFADLIGAWYRGDADGVAAILNEAEDVSEEFSEVLLYRRNAVWAVTLDQLIREETGTFFVAVGAAHLAGDRSVQDYLAEKGHVAERLPVE